MRKVSRYQIHDLQRNERKGEENLFKKHKEIKENCHGKLILMFDICNFALSVFIFCLTSLLISDLDFCRDHEKDSMWLQTHERENPTSTC